MAYKNCTKENNMLMQDEDKCTRTVCTNETSPTTVLPKCYPTELRVRRKKEKYKSRKADKCH